MSLVHEALEKAKREASAKSAQELGLPETRSGAGQPFRARRRIHPAVVAAAAVALTLGAVGAAFWWSRSRAAAPAPAPSGLPAASAPAPSPGPIDAPAAAVDAPSPAPVPTLTVETAAPIQHAAAPSAAPASPVTPSAAPASPSVQTRTPSEPAITQPSPPARAAPRGESTSAPSFVRQTTLADGTTLRLGGIAWSVEAPLAYLNGKLYAKGESVAGLFIERIERERVLLSGERGRIYLTLR